MCYGVIGVFLYARSSRFGAESYGRVFTAPIRVFKAVAQKGNIVRGALEFNGNAFSPGAVVAE